MGATGRATPRLLCLCAFACVVFYFATYQVSADSQVDTDIVFDNLETHGHDKPHHILRRNTQHRANLHNKQKSSQQGDEEHWVSNTLHRLKRQLFDFFGTATTEAPVTENQQQVEEDDQTIDNEVNQIDEDARDIVDEFKYKESPKSDDQIAELREPTDDEDLSPTHSGDDQEGSGDVDQEEDVVTHPDLEGKPVYYRVTFAIHEPYIEAYENPESPEFRKIAGEIERSVDEVYQSLEGTQTAKVIRIQKRDEDVFTSKVTLDLGSIYLYDSVRIKNHLYSQLESYKTLGSVQALTDDFDFREFEDKVSACKPDEIPCRSGACIPVTGRCDGVPDCADNSDEAGCEIPSEAPTIQPFTPPEVQTSVHHTVQETTTETVSSPPTRITYPLPTSLPIIPRGDGSPERKFEPIYPVTTPAANLTPSTTLPTSAPTSFPTSDRCRADDKVRCGDSSVYICADQECDGVPDCPNGEDEDAEICQACAEGEFSCDLKRCIPADKRCDGVRDCDDETDERECPAPECTSGQFRCDDGRCIENSQRCDGRYDCSRAEDETNCPERDRCRPDQFKCDDGSCIEGNRKCDGYSDCSGGEEEYGCPEGCNSAEEFTCGDGKCIPIAAKCDRTYDCPDQSDEKNCPCKPDDYYCSNGFCIPKIQHCDGIRNCQDGSDEIGCTKSGPCEYYKWRCHDGTCIDQINRCDLEPDCPDGSDEVGCSCGHDEFRCNNGTCLSIEKICDGTADCPFSEDEESCALCKAQEFRCENGDCISVSGRCNGSRDCTDGSDEEDCNGKTTLECSMGSWMCHDNLKCIPKITLCDGKFDCQDHSDELCDAFANTPEPENIEKRKGESANACPESEFQCAAGYCVMGYKRCNGIKDCPSGNDEENCPITTSPPEPTCQVDQFRCPDGQCISAAFRCDTIPDCEDKSDEIDCGDLPAGVECGIDEVKCEDGTCGRRCDHIFDCIDGSDETNCDWCAPNQYTCAAGGCIDETLRCDGKPQCSDGSDERDCVYTCPQDQFRCDNGLCLLNARRCDGFEDCPDGSDEKSCQNATCKADEYQCSNKKCISQSFLCDGYDDCEDGGDETNCTTRCEPGEFDCGDNECIPLSRKCNGREDCSNGLDEFDCVKPACSPNEFTCGDGSCISNYQICDGSLQCSDGSDERDCGTCADPDWFQCSGGACIAASLRCDNYYDCRDFSDEQNCFGCHSDQFTCETGECIPSQRRCDRRHDCSDGSDEANCPTEAPKVPECPPGQLPCRSRNECYPSSGTCDGIAQCSDRTDEYNCHNEGGHACSEGYFRCENGPCIKEELRCNTKVDCPSDSSDELDCPEYAHGPYYQAPYPAAGLNLKTYPNAQDIKESREVVFQCRDEGPIRARVHWIRGNGQALPPGSRDVNGRLEIPNIQLEHSGAYICEALGVALNTPGSQVTVHLNVEKLEPPKPTRPPQACALHEATCANGDCISKQLVCDGKFDCRDGSDETRCSPHGCEPNEFRCSNKRCVLKTWVCDSDDDCGDGTDEESCATSVPGSPCGSHQFACRSGNQCIPRSFHCDQERDCVDGSDEIGCSPVTIARPPPPMQELVVGEIFEITCTAVGVPTPQIVWRLNWGHIPEKCKTTSVNGVGTLTCPDIQESDQGAYSCEAINIRGSVIAVPDTILVVKPLDKTVCPRGYFNEEARNPSECLSCFCFGVTDECHSADLFTYQLQPPFDSHRILGVRVNPHSGVVDIRDEPIYAGVQPRVTPAPGRNGVHAYLSAPAGQLTQPDVLPYFVMPENYNGNQLKSYGGYLKYNLRYLGSGRPTSFAPDIILTGNGYTLLHVDTPHQPGREESITVRFFVGDWIKRSDNAQEKLATREEIMMALASTQNILMKLQYVDGHLDTTLENIEMDSAAVRNTGLGQAVFVEECRCPVGYTGLSCESCAPGYARHHSGPWLGKCYKKEEICPPGTYGDPSRGIACNICPCPLTNPSNQFGRTCSLAPDGDVICDCPPGYVGRRCEHCAAGYSGNPLVPGDSCRAGICSSEGALYPEPDSSGRCACKDLTDGPTCNHCKPNAFYLSADNQFGCIACFCMGITSQCSSSNWYRDTISTVFTRSKGDFKIVDAQNKESPAEQGIILNPNAREITYSNFSSRSPEVKYWYLPSRYLGDKVTAYGGNLKYSFRYVPAPGGQSSRNTAPDVELMSKNHIKLWYYHRDSILPNTVQTVSVPLIEQYWQRNDGQKADREHLLMALADLEAILIKATYTTSSREVALTSVSLDTADERNTGSLVRALAVEQCHCPTGYKGLSCEDCDVGYKRATEGIYLGLCERCECTGHSNECDSETGECFNCRDHTTGPNCEECLPGYNGDPVNRVPCYTTDVNCICDSRGSIGPNCYGGSCQCKTNVVGQTCNRCREGTFGLNDSLPEGCQSCFCSGVATECSESNLHVLQIPSQIIDPENHGFTLVDQYNTKRITNGFQLNIAMNEIGYIFRPSESERLFWSLPTNFTGNHLKSYGGKLEFTQRYTQRPEARYILDQDVVIIGNGITIYWTNPQEILQPDIANKVSVVLSPASQLQRLDHRLGPRPASREDILRVLTSIDAILIRAQQSSDTSSSFISDITLDTAIDSFTGQGRATNVEVCRCPTGYRGTSCESCSSGYYRDISDISTGPLGSCSRCPCNNREESCSLGPDNRVACNCLPGFRGPDCRDHELTEQTPTPYPPPTPPPTPTVVVQIPGPKLQIVEAGSNVRLFCNARSTTPNAVRIHWTKDGGSLPDRSVDDFNGLLVITDIRISDSGRYICEASDGVSIVSQHITLTVGENEPVPPSTSVTPSYSEINEGELLELRCHASGNPTPDLHWRRTDGIYLNPDHSFANGVLIINRARVSDSGDYECVATNAAGSHSSSVRVHVKRVQEPLREPVITPYYYSGRTGDSFTLTCESNDQIREIRWSRQGGYLPYNSRDQNGVLTITDAKPEDSALYICIVTSYTGQTGNKSASVTISPILTGGRPPTVYIKPKNQTVPQGTTVELYCEASGTPPPTIKWTKVHEELGPNAQQVGSILRIRDVQVSDRGIYVCVANIGNSVAQDSSYLEVERREKPVVELHPSRSQTIIQGSSAILQCRVLSGIPEPVVTWSRPSGQPLSSRIEQLSSGVLRFTGITTAESGEYICSARNEAGFETASGSIVVQIPPQLTINPTSPLQVQSGEYVRLECRATGEPTPSVQWTKYGARRDFEDVSFTSRDSAQVLSHAAVYEITRASEADEGTYICLGRNEAGAAEGRLQLLVDTYPKRGDITGEDAGSDKIERPYIPPSTKDNEQTPNIFDESFTAPVGTRAELRCRVSNQDRPGQIYMSWVRADNSSLPRDSVVRDGILYINDVQPSDAGEYRCYGTSPSSGVLFSVTAKLVVVSPPRITLEPSRQIVRPGDNAIIQCLVTGDQPIDVTWHAMDRPMPRTVHVTDGDLRFQGIQVSDAGKYRCTATNTAGEADAVAEVLVDEKEQQPTVSEENREQNSMVGSSVTLHCTVSQAGRPDVRWFREHQPLPVNSRVSGEYLQIFNLQAVDAGRYYCQVRTPEGYSTDYINLQVDFVRWRCTHREWQCNDGTCIREWQLCDKIVDCGDVSDELYCRHRRLADQPAIQPPELTIQPSSPTARLGDIFDLHCRSNEHGVITTWSKVNGRLAENTQTSGGTLRFNSVRYDNAGTYRCEARGHTGYYNKDYNVEIVESNEAPSKPVMDIKTAPQGSMILMECKTDLEQPVSYQWRKQGGNLPRDANPYSRTIQINDVTSNDAGTYVCTASNGRKTIDIPTILIITGIVPYFTQAPNSFVALPSLPDSYLQFNFEISFKPESPDGLILYNGDKGSTENSDFISLALVNGIPEFRFNLGLGVTVIAADNPIEIGKWHTIKLHRNRKKATMFVDDEGPFIGIADGKHSGLSLREPLYLGGVPDYRNIVPEAEIDTGFVGCISQFKIGHVYHDILRDSNIKTGVTTCETCSENPCQNQGVCQEALSKQGFSCICSENYSGPTCSKLGGESCTPYACGNGRCVDNENSYECYCPLGHAGRRCEREISVIEPAFLNDAYVAYPTLKTPRRLKVSLKIKPNDLSDGVLLYCGESDDGYGDFASLALKDGHVEFRFDVGNGPTIIRSQKQLTPGNWVAVTATRSLSDGRLLVNGETPVVGRSPGNHKALNLYTPLYVGGFDKTKVRINDGVGVNSGFNGCISEISVSGVDLHIIQSATDSANVQDCSAITSYDNNESANDIEGDTTQYSHENSRPYESAQTGCTNNPCRNEGQCLPLSPTEYKCSCINGYTGRDCEIAPNQCDQLRPCQNGGTCTGTTERYNCDCPLGYTGINCEQRAELRNDVHFSGNGYLEFNRSLLPHDDDEANEVIAFELSTNASNGLIFWHGQTPNEEGQGQDYIALAVVNDYLEFSYDLGSGRVIINNRRVKISDGERHKVILKRQGKSGSIEIDDEYLVEGENPGITSKMNCNGNIYLGGTPNLSLMTGRFHEGFNGCIHGFEIQDSQILELGAKAVSGLNVKACSSSNDIYDEYDEDDFVN